MSRHFLYTFFLKVSEEDTLTFLENIKMYMEEAKLYLELVENLQNGLKEDTFIDLEQMEEGKTEANKDIQTSMLLTICLMIN